MVVNVPNVHYGLVQTRLSLLKTTAGTVPNKPPTAAPQVGVQDLAANSAHGDGETVTVDLHDHNDSSAWTEIEYDDAILQEANSTIGFCNLGDLPAALNVP